MKYSISHQISKLFRGKFMFNEPKTAAKGVLRSSRSLITMGKRGPQPGAALPAKARDALHKAHARWLVWVLLLSGEGKAKLLSVNTDLQKSAKDTMLENSIIAAFNID